MKKYVKQIIVAVIVATVVSCALYCFDTYNNTLPAKAKNVVDAAGTTYLAVYDTDGNEYVAVTDENGRVYAAEFENGTLGEPVTDINGNIYYLNSVSASDLPENTTAPAYSISDYNSTQYTGAASEIVTAATQQTTAQPETQPTTEPVTESAASQTQEPTKVTEPEQTTAKPSEPKPTRPTQAAETTQKPELPDRSTLLAEKYKKVFEGGTYKMEFTTNDEELSEAPVTAAFKNGNILMRTTLMGIDLTILYFPKTNEGFLIIHRYKKYCKLPDSLLEDMTDTASTGAIDDGEYVSVDVKDVVIDGETLRCEEYTIDTGAIVKYYFKDGSLVRRDRIETDGMETDMFINSVTSDVPDSDFEIPSNYSNINISWLSFLLDSEEVATE